MRELSEIVRENFHWILAGIGLIALLPVVVALKDAVHIDTDPFDVTILNGIRPLWAVPLIYLGMAGGTILLFPASLKFFWLFHVMLLAKGVELVMVLGGTEPFVTLPVEMRVTPLYGAAALACAAILAGSWWRLAEWDILRLYRQTLDAGRYVVPFRAIEETSEEFVPRPRLSLAKDRSLLVYGETGAGKTALLSLLTYQLQAAPDEPFVVFDFKGEYREFLADTEQHDRDVIRLSSTGATHFWNLFAEIDDESEVDELARALFPQTREAEFFSTAARQLFGAVIKLMLKKAADEETTPTNADLVTFVQETDRDEMYELLMGYDDLQPAARAIDPDADRQAAGVYANFQQVIADMFRGDFARMGSFSIREYMTNPDGRTLLLEYPIQEGDAVAPAFRFFVDWSARYALDDSRGAYFLLDEFARLPELRKTEELINVGRSSNTQLLLGVQSVAQLHDTYGTDTANSLLSGLVQSIALRVGDGPTLEYIRSQLGTEQTERSVPDRDQDGRSVGSQEIQDESHPISEADLLRLDDGEAIAIRADGWQRGQLKQLQDVQSRLDRALETEQ
jgi:energy-coupling factor transporter ATP-binding protein EcfA2